MKKVLIAFDGANFSQGAFDFACRLNEQEPVLLTGVFLPSIDYTKLINYLGGIEGYVLNTGVDINDEIEAIEVNIEVFKALCVKNNIEHRIHDRINGSIMEGIRKETRYSDVFILSSDLFYSNLNKRSQEKQLHDALRLSECPVIVLPELYDFPQTPVLAFDGSESSVFAIKQFAYLFPEFKSADTIIVYASEKDTDMPDFHHIKEYAARHFSNLNFLKLDTGPKDHFTTWMTDLTAPILVSGSYGRTAISEFFSGSFIEEVIGEHKLPVFITHK